MIVSTADLPGLSGTVAMVDGGFDPLHAGHVDYFEAAAELGLPVLCNVSSDAYIASKHPPLLPGEQRARIIDSIRYVSYVHLSDIATVEVLERLRPRMYVKGDDWKGRLPEAETEACERLGIEVRYLDTVRDSSSKLLASFQERSAR